MDVAFDGEGFGGGECGGDVEDYDVGVGLADGVVEAVAAAFGGVVG